MEMPHGLGCHNPVNCVARKALNGLWEHRHFIYIYFFFFFFF